MGSPGVAVATRPSGKNVTPPADGPKRAPSNTPRVMSAWRTLVVVLLVLFTGLTLFGTAYPAYTLSASISDVQQGQRLRLASAAVAEADQIAADAFLDPPAAAGELSQFQTRLDQATHMLIEAAAASPADASRLGDVQQQVSDYRRAVESAWAQAATGQSGASSFIAAGDRLKEPETTLSALAADADSRVTTGLSGRFGDWAVVAGWVALVALIGACVVMAQRTRRVVNLGLAAAVGLVLIGVLVVGAQNDTVAKNTTMVTSTTLLSGRAAAEAQTSAFQAKAAESRTYLGSTTGAADWSSADQRVKNSLTMLTYSLSSTPSTQWAAYTAAHAAIQPSNPNAKALGRSTGAGGTLGPLRTFTSTMGQLADSQAADAVSSLRTARSPLAGIAWVSTLAGLLAAAAATMGITRRLSEYR